MVKRAVPVLLALAALALAACQAGPDALAGQPTLTSQQLQGRQIFNQGCAACHALTPDTRLVGPSLFNIGQIAETRVPGLDAGSYLEQAIVDPGAHIVPGYEDLMPSTFGTTLASEELDALVAFLFSLK